MKLNEIIDNKNTDKNTRHSYIPIYQKLFEKKKNSCKNILEIGLGDRPQVYGGSTKLWLDYFNNSQVYTIDILNENFYKGELINYLKNHERSKIFFNTNAYDLDFVSSNFNFKFDIIIDDGDHSKKSMIKFIKYYLPLLEDNGILVIEDIRRIKWIKEFKKIIPENLKKYIEIYDLRKNKNRYDDILFVLNKGLN